ncbi:hypothetical protein Tco_0349627 [Tanacetum coccineum]
MRTLASGCNSFELHPRIPISAATQFGSVTDWYSEARNMSETRQGLNSAAIKQLINQHVADAMAAYEANRSNGNANQNKAGGSAGGVEHTTRG